MSARQSRVILATLVFTIGSAARLAADPPQTSSNDVSSSQVYADPLKAKRVAAAFGSNNFPHWVIDFGSVDQIFFECRLEAMRDGRPVKNVKMDVQFLYVNPSNQFQAFVDQNVKTNRFGDAYASVAVDFSDPLFDALWAADFWGVFAVPTNGKLIDQFKADCFVAEREADSRFHYINQPGLDEDRYAIFGDFESFEDGILDIGDELWELDLVDRLNKASRLDVTWTRREGELDSLTDIFLADTFKGTTYPDPILDELIFADGFESGDTSAWFN